MAQYRLPEDSVSEFVSVKEAPSLDSISVESVQADLFQSDADAVNELAVIVSRTAQAIETIGHADAVIDAADAGQLLELADILASCARRVVAIARLNTETA